LFIGCVAFFTGLFYPAFRIIEERKEDLTQGHEDAKGAKETDEHRWVLLKIIERIKSLEVNHMTRCNIAKIAKIAKNTK
jgi:hypothetical protein